LGSCFLFGSFVATSLYSLCFTFISSLCPLFYVVLSRLLIGLSANRNWTLLNSLQFVFCSLFFVWVLASSLSTPQLFISRVSHLSSNVTHATASSSHGNVVEENYELFCLDYHKIIKYLGAIFILWMCTFDKSRVFIPFRRIIKKSCAICPEYFLLSKFSVWLSKHWNHITNHGKLKLQGCTPSGLIYKQKLLFRFIQ
jgi:hypothetical protein